MTQLIPLFVPTFFEHSVLSLHQDFTIITRISRLPMKALHYCQYVLHIVHDFWWCKKLGFGCGGVPPLLFIRLSLHDGIFS